MMLLYLTNYIIPQKIIIELYRVVVRYTRTKAKRTQKK